jgi:hypothetical protein
MANPALDFVHGLWQRAKAAIPRRGRGADALSEGRVSESSSASGSSFAAMEFAPAPEPERSHWDTIVQEYTNARFGENGEERPGWDETVRSVGIEETHLSAIKNAIAEDPSLERLRPPTDLAQVKWWDGKDHAGPVFEADGHTVVHIKGSEYQLLDPHDAEAVDLEGKAAGSEHNKPGVFRKAQSTGSRGGSGVVSAIRDAIAEDPSLEHLRPPQNSRR